MRKFLGITVALFLLLIPTIGLADLIDKGLDTDSTIGLNLTYTPWVYGEGYYTDYQAFVNGTEKQAELFCVEKQAAHVGYTETYELYKLAITETNIIAAWIAETNWNKQPLVKGQAQLAIWDLLNTIGDNDIVSTVAIPSIDGLEDYTGNWLLATNANYQDYLMRAPVPEPATLLLLGTGLIGLAGFSRKKFKK